MTALSELTNENKCGICLYNYIEEDIKTNNIIEHRSESGKHQFHKDPCLRNWALIKDECPFRCGIGILSAVPFRQRMLRTCSEFFKTRPAVQILAIGVPLLAINTAAIAAVGRVAAAAAAAAATIGVVSFIAGGGVATIAAAAAGGGATAGGALAGLAAVVEAEAVVVIIGEGAGLVATAVGGAAAGILAAIQGRDFFSVGTATAGIAFLSALINGGGLPLAMKLAAISSTASYLEAISPEAS